MAIILVRHKVADYDTWRPHYDEHADERAEAGCTGTHLFRSLSDPNEVIINLQWDTLENAQKFAASADLAETMKRAGVVDKPDIWFLDDAGRTAS